jgi:hypothetical protein
VKHPLLSIRSLDAASVLCLPKYAYFAYRQSFGVRKPCLRLYGNKAEAWLSCQGHDKQSISVLYAEASFSQAVLFTAQCHCHAFCQAYEVCQRANMQASALKHQHFGCRMPNLLLRDKVSGYQTFSTGWNMETHPVDSKSNLLNRNDTII